MAKNCKVCRRSTWKSPAMGGCAGHTTKQSPYRKTEKDKDKPTHFRTRKETKNNEWCSCGALIRNGKCVALDCGKKVK